MLFDSRYSHYWCNFFLIVSLICLICAGYAYLVNARRAADDPEKRDFHIGAIFLAPITWPLLLLVYIMYILVRIIQALMYSIVLILALVALLVFRKPFLFKWLDKILTAIGNRLLEINTYLIRMMFGKLINVSPS